MNKLHMVTNTVKLSPDFAEKELSSHPVNVDMLLKPSFYMWKSLVFQVFWCKYIFSISFDELVLFAGGFS